MITNIKIEGYIDLPLLMKQKKILAEVAERQPGANTKDALVGILNLLDTITDSLEGQQ